MRITALADTGALLALLDRSDRWHQTCVETFKEFRLPLWTSQAVLTELFHMVGDNRKQVEATWKFLRMGAIEMVELENADLAEIQALMSRYADCPMDFADATLVLLARKKSVSTVFTVDQNDFATYRIEGKKKFRLLPAQRP